MNIKKYIKEEMSSFDWADEIKGDDFHVGTRFRHRGEKYDYHSWNVWEITSIDPNGYVGVKQVIKEGYPVENNHDTRNIPYERFKDAYDSGSFENESVRNDIDMMIYPGAKFIIEEAWWEGEKDGIRHPREEGKIVLEITETNEWGDSKYKVIESDLTVGEPVGTEDEAEIDTIRNFIADGWWKPYGSRLTEDFDWAEGLPDTITTEYDIEHFLGRGINHIDLRTGEPVAEDEGRVIDLKYWIELNGDEPEAYNVCWDEVIEDEDGTRNVFKTCTRFRASTIVRMFREGEFKLMSEDLDEQVVKEDFGWVDEVPEVELGKHFDEEDLEEKITFFEHNNTVRFVLDFDEFNDLVADGYEDYYFKDLVLSNGTYVDEGDSDYFDDEEINYLPNFLSEDQLDRLMEVLKRSAKLFDLKGQTVDGPLQTIINEQFLDAEPYLGRNLYRGRDDWDDLTGNYMYYVGKHVNMNRWRSLNQYYLRLLEEQNVEIEGDWRSEEVIVTVPFPYKQTKWKWDGNHNVEYQADPINNLTEIFTKGLIDIGGKPWSDYWFEDYDTRGVAGEIRPDFDRFIEKIEEALTEKGV
jgi:hypothetical protein